MVLRLVNDESNLCRATVASSIFIIYYKIVLKVLVCRVPQNMINKFLKYLNEWLINSNKNQLKRISLQTYGLFLEVKPEIIKQIPMKEIIELLITEMKNCENFIEEVNEKENEIINKKRENLFVEDDEKVTINIEEDSNKYLFNNLPWQLTYYICILIEKMMKTV